MFATNNKQLITRLFPWFGAVACVAAGVVVGWQLQSPTPPEELSETNQNEGFSSTENETTLSAFTNPANTPGEFQPVDSPPTSDSRAAVSSPSSAAAPPRHLKLDEPDSPIARMLLASDEWLRMGYFSRALAGFETVLQHSEAQAIESIKFRMALCHEFLGEWSRAQVQYRNLAKSVSFPQIRQMSQLGEARCLITRGETELLKTQYFPSAILNETTYSSGINGEMLHLIGRALVQDSKQREPLWREAKPEDSENLAVPDMDYSPGKILDQLKTPQPQPDIAEIPVFQVLQKSVDSPDGCFVRMNQPKVSVRSLLTEMVGECGFNSQISEAADVVIQGHGQTLVVSDKSLSLLLDGICMRFGLVWSVAENSLSITTVDEADPADVSEFTKSLTERLLRWAILTSPGSRQAHASQLLLGVVHFDRKQYAEASHVFQIYLERHPHTTLTGLAAFNLARCYLNNGQYAEAEEAMLRAVDHTHSTLDTRIAAYMQLGRLRLENGNIKASLSTLVRGLSQSRGHKSEGDISLLLASAYLLADNPQGANSILMERRSQYKTSDQKEASAFLSSYCRLRRAADRNRIIRETRAVISALTHFRPNRMLGRHWYLLVAAAYEDVGLRTNAISTHLAALKERLPEFVMSHSSVQLAELYVAEKEFEKAKLLFGALPEISNDKLRNRALLGRAGLAFQMEEFAAARNFAAKVARTSTDVDLTREALRLLGQSYEKQGNFRAAVYCYAGMVPDTDEQSVLNQVSHTAADGSMERGRK